MMKKLLLTALALLFALGLSACKDKAAKVVNPEERDWSNKDIVIWVDESGIPLGELRAEMHRQMLHMPQGLSEDQTKAYQARATQISIENLIVRRLLERELDRSGILIPQSEVDEAKKVLEAGLGEGRTLTMLIAEVNLPMDVLEANLRLDLFKNKVLSNEFATAWAAITDDYAKTYYDEHPDEFTQPAGRFASHILIRVPQDADDMARMKARNKAEEVRKALLEGADFAQLAATSSECASRTRGGDLGFIPRGREAPAFEEAVYSQPIGQIGAVVESPVGYHVIKVTREQEERLVPFEEVRQTLVNGLKRREQQRIIAEFIKGLREKSLIRFDGPLAPQQNADQPASTDAAPAEDAPAAPAEGEG
ncbi:MAG: peptidylprolyl isomerase [Kiritimatiellae bacterium]|nr:peptidylprolyl isomerase [Kiritimatiellia bacterium]